MYQLHNIKFSQGGFRLEIENLTLRHGGIYAIVGPNGSGKSTFLNILAHLLHPDSGEMFIDERKIDLKKSALALRRQAAYLMQDPYLFNMSAGDNVALGLKLRGTDSAAADRKAAEIMNAFQIGHLVDRPADRLSGGEAQKTALARTLVQDARLVLLDEPTGNIDQKDLSMVEQIIRNSAESADKIIVFSSHSREQAYRLSNHIIPILNGRIRNISYENIYRGILTKNSDGSRSILTDTGITVYSAGGDEGSVTIAIDPEDILISVKELKSSALNRLKGSITRVEVVNESLRVSVDAGMEIRVLMTAKSFHDLNLNIGKTVWITFKASAVKVFNP